MTGHINLIELRKMLQTISQQWQNMSGVELVTSNITSSRGNENGFASEDGVLAKVQVPSEDETHAVGEVPSEDGVLAKVQVPSEDGTHDGGEVPSEDSVHDKVEVPSEGGTHAKVEVPSEGGTHAEGEIPSEDRIPAEAEVPSEDGIHAEAEFRTKYGTYAEGGIHTVDAINAEGAFNPENRVLAESAIIRESGIHAESALNPEDGIPPNNAVFEDGINAETWAVELSSILSPLNGLCTYQVLHDARTYKYGEYDIFPREWDDPNLELLALDKAIHVPNDSPQTKKIFRAACKFMTRLLDLLTNLDPMWNKVVASGEQRPRLFYCLEPIGSYPSDNKIIDINEFDFLLIILGHSSRVEKYASVSKVVKNIPAALEALREVDNVRVQEVYFHGPASCVELAWICGQGHHHELGLDLTPAYPEEGYKIRDFLSEVPNTHIVPFDKLISLINPDENVLRVKNEATTALLDVQMFNIVGHISENIRSLYRILKLVNRLLLLHLLERSPDSSRGRVSSALVSAHHLKRLVFRMVQNFPEKISWDTSNLHFRFMQLVNNLFDEVVGETLDQFTRCDDFFEVGGKKFIWRFHYDPKSSIKSSFSSVIHSLRGYLLGRRSFNTAPSNLNTNFLWGCDRLHTISDFSQLPCGASDLVYSTYLPPMIYLKHPLVCAGLYALEKFFTDFAGANLAEISDLNFQTVWGLFKGGALSIFELRGQYGLKLAEFRRLCLVVGVDESSLLSLYIRDYLIPESVGMVLRETYPLDSSRLALESLLYFSCYYLKLIKNAREEERYRIGKKTWREISSMVPAERQMGRFVSGVKIDELIRVVVNYLLSWFDR